MFRKRIVFLCASLVCVAPPALAQDAVAAFYRGRTITVVIPSSAGGGYDLYGRIVARHIGRFIPGNPTVTPQNMPGAGGLVAAQYVYAVGAKDGTVIGEAYPAALMAEVMGDKSKINYDARKFNYLGSVTTESFRVCYVGGKSGVNRFEDAFDHEVVVGGTGVGGPATDYPVLYNNVLGTKFRVVNGYPGVAEIDLAILKGEVQGHCGAGYGALLAMHPGAVESGQFRIIAEENLKLHPDTAHLHIPMTPSFAKTPEVKELFNFYFSQSGLGRPFMMAPEVPADRVKALRGALAAMVKDKEFLAEAAKMKIDIVDPMEGEAFAAEVRQLLSTSPAVIARLKQALVPKK
jgi:tripartite-type tricarboxylate transporter receptor subunit TctC